MDERTLIRKCLKGDSIAHKTLFDTFAPKMLAVAIRYMKSTEEAEDMLQDGFIKVFDKLKSYNQKGSLEGWIRRIIVNTCLDQLRRNAKFQNNTQVEQVDYKLEKQDFIEEQLMADDLLQLINSMPDGYRTIFNLFALEGYSHKEIAETLGISENTSKSQYSRARSFLKEKLEVLKIGREG